jgi:hypothetical protein
VRQRGEWLLASQSKLPAIEMRGSDGCQIGWLLGYPIDQDGQLRSSSSALGIDARVADGPGSFERSLYTLGGRFAAIYLTPDSPRVYLDPSGSMAVVFCPELGIAASSTNLIPYSATTQENHELIRAIGSPERDGWYPFGLTPRHGIERLLPNHFLDLSTWGPVRHWPHPGALTINGNTGSAVAEIASILERQIGAVARVGPLYLALTAGKHTRMLLACARNHLDRITCFTISIQTAQGVLDHDIARRMARRFGFAYRALKWEEPTEIDLDEWLYRTGACVGGQTWRTVRTFRQLDPQRGVMSGLVGGVGQSPFRRSDDRETGPMSPRDVLDRLDQPALPEIVDRAERWLGELPVAGTVWAAEFLHLEQRYGCWGGPQEYGHVHAAFLLSPYSHRRVFHLLLTLPPEYRWSEDLPRGILENRWPELLEFPLNKPVGVKRGLQVFKSILRSMAR